MLSTTLEEGLRNYEIGEKVKALRLRKKMALVELGKHTGLSAALLSKIERSNIYPPLPTLLRIALVFGVGLDYFFRDETTRPVVAVMRKKDRLRFPAQEEGPISYFFESLDFNANERKFDVYLAHFQALSVEEAPSHAHEGFEFLYLLSGKLSLTTGRHEHQLGEGDAIYFDASVPHSYRQISKSACVAVTVTSR